MDSRIATDLEAASLYNQETYDELVARFGDVAREADPTPAWLRCEHYVGENLCGRPLVIAAYGSWYGTGAPRIRRDADGLPLLQTYGDEEHA